MSEQPRYRMTRAGAGTYMLPSNDLRDLFKIYSYDEDGSLQRGDGRGGWKTVLGTFWGFRRFDGGREAALRFAESVDTMDDFLWAEKWVGGEDGFATRREAVAAALERGGSLV